MVFALASIKQLEVIKLGSEAALTPSFNLTAKHKFAFFIINLDAHHIR